jgi:Zn-dependent M32 family carboxypeptidase
MLAASAREPVTDFESALPLTLPDAHLRHTADRFARAEHWQEVSKDLEARMSRNFAAVGERTVAQGRLIKDIAAHTSDMLDLLVDKFEPRDFKQQAQEEFKEVLAQIQALCPNVGSLSPNV